MKIESIDDARDRANHFYMLEDENLKGLWNLEIKKQFSDGWAFILKPRNKESASHLQKENFLILGKDGSESQVMPDGENMIDRAKTVDECRELWQKHLHEEAMEKGARYEENAERAKQTVIRQLGREISPNDLKVAELEPEYWCVSWISDDGRTIGGAMYIVNTEGKVYTGTASQPPRLNLAAAKSFFGSSRASN